jgi:hypothetical protein
MIPEKLQTFRIGHAIEQLRQTLPPRWRSNREQTNPIVTSTAAPTNMVVSMPPWVNPKPYTTGPIA